MNKMVSITLIALAIAVNASAAAPATPAQPTNKFELQVSRIANAFEGYSTYKVTSDKPEQMLKEYLQVKYGADAADYKIDLKATGINQDTSEVGLISKATAYNEVTGQLLDDDTVDYAKENGKQAVDFLTMLQEVRYGLRFANQYGAVYGYDASEQNGCAAPTPYLLILDPKSKIVYGIDLFPCHE